MSYNEDDIIFLLDQMRDLYQIKTGLETRFPGRKFTIDGHLLGSAGEVLAAYHYNLGLFRSSEKSYDAVTADGRKVQIKATQGKRISIGSKPDYLVVLLFDLHSGEAREVYNGPGEKVWNACGTLSSNGTRSITLSRLRRFSSDVEKSQRIEPVWPIKSWLEEQ